MSRSAREVTLLHLSTIEGGVGVRFWKWVFARDWVRFSEQHNKPSFLTLHPMGWGIKVQRNIFLRSAWNVQICTDKACLPTSIHGEVWVGNNLQKTCTRNWMWCPDLHRKVIFPSLHPNGGGGQAAKDLEFEWNVQICKRKLSLKPSSSNGVVGGYVLKHIFAFNS